MDRLILRSEIVDAIKRDQLLYGKMAYLLGVSIRSMPRILAANSPKLTEAAVIKILKEHLKISKDSDLLMPTPHLVEA